MKHYMKHEDDPMHAHAVPGMAGLPCAKMRPKRCASCKFWVSSKSSNGAAPCSRASALFKELGTRKRVKLPLVPYDTHACRHFVDRSDD